MRFTVKSKLIAMFLMITALTCMSQAHRPFPDVGCLHSFEPNCILEVKKPTFRKYELNFVGPVSEYGYECGTLATKLYQQITAAEVLLQVIPGTIQLKKISSLTKMIDPVPQVNCAFSAESLSKEVRIFSDRKTISRGERSEEEMLKECQNLLQSYENSAGFFANTIYLPHPTIENGYTSCDVVNTRLEKK